MTWTHSHFLFSPYLPFSGAVVPPQSRVIGASGRNLSQMKWCDT